MSFIIIIVIFVIIPHSLQPETKNFEESEEKVLGYIGNL